MATNVSKTSASGYNRIKPGQSPSYDSYLTYDAETDPISGMDALYDSIGYASTGTNVAKNTASPTNLAKT